MTCEKIMNRNICVMIGLHRAGSTHVPDEERRTIIYFKNETDLYFFMVLFYGYSTIQILAVLDIFTLKGNKSFLSNISIHSSNFTDIVVDLLTSMVSSVHYHHLKICVFYEHDMAFISPSLGMGGPCIENTLKKE